MAVWQWALGLTLLLLFIGGIFFLYFKWQDSKEKKRTQESNIEDTEQRDINSRKVKIVLYEWMSKDTLRWVDDIEGEEKPDEVGNKIVFGNLDKFKEDFNFSIDRAYESLEYELNFKNKKLQEKESILNKAIEETELILKECDKKNPEYMNKYNYRDTDLKLRQLRVLKDCLRLDNKGNYVRIGKGGVRQYDMVVEDGLLYPLHFGSRGYRVNPDLRNKKKIYNSENVIFNKEWSSILNKGVEWTGLILCVIGLVTIILGLLMNWYAFTTISEPYQQLSYTAERQLDTINSINQIYGEDLLDYLKNNTKSVAINTNNINTANPNLNIGGVIDINPNQIGNTN